MKRAIGVKAKAAPPASICKKERREVMDLSSSKISANDSAFVHLTPAVSAEKMLSNMRSALARDLPEVTPCKPHSGILSIAGGGPSLADTYRELHGFICAVNGSLAFLLGHDIKDGASYACGVMDAGAHIADALVADKRVRYYVASICDPAVFDKLQGCDVRLWHVSPQSTQDPTGVMAMLNEAHPDTWLAVGGGCTMGLRWINLGYVLGFRKFHAHGLDSSFRDGATHAYPDRADTKDRVLFNGRHTRPNFLAQVYDFFGVVNVMATRDPDVEIKLFGDGLLQDEWQAFNAATDGRHRRVGDFWWPMDNRAAHAALIQVRSLADVIPFCRQRRVAVQAGGNVGVYARYLAQHFDGVVTLEPDTENFECLLRNVPEANVSKIEAAVGNEAKRVGMLRNPTNVGAHRIDGDGDIPVVRIDDLGLEACDFLCLDVEGYEMEALRGAVKTIARDKPVILFESNGLGAHFGVTKGDIQSWLNAEFGYREVLRCGRDVVMAC